MNSESSTLGNATADARMALRDASDGELSWASRQRLHHAVEAQWANAPPRIHTFHRSLGWQSALKVWDVWQQSFPDDQQPKTVAEICSGIGTDRPAKLGALARLNTHLDDKFLLGDQHFPAVYAGFSWWAVARDGLNPTSPVQQSGSEMEINPDEWSPAYLASLAASESATWEGIGGTDERRAFWDWYLTEAVPTAYEQAIAS